MMRTTTTTIMTMTTMMTSTMPVQTTTLHNQQKPPKQAVKLEVEIEAKMMTREEEAGAPPTAQPRQHRHSKVNARI